MELHIEPVTARNREAALRLTGTPEQDGFVESVAACLAEAGQRRCWRPVVLYDGGSLIGFAMYGFFPEYFPFGRLWLDRLLIDKHFQGRGYGRAAMQALLVRLSQEYPRRRRVFLSVYEENTIARRLYEKLGFRVTGEKDLHGETVMVRPLDRNTPQLHRHGGKS